MIDSSSVIYWRHRAPWGKDVQVKQDLIVSMALIELLSIKV
jgi:hypothetical protein